MIRKSTLKLLTALVLLSTCGLTAQDLLQYIPSEAAVVLSIDPSTVKTKVDVAALKQLEVTQMMAREWARDFYPENEEAFVAAFNDPQRYGMDLDRASYFFYFNKGSDAYYGYLFALSDADAFSKFYKSTLFNAEKGLRLIEDGDVIMATTGSAGIAWNEEMAMITSVQLERDYDWDWEEDYGEYEEEEYIEEEYGEEEIVEEEFEDVMLEEPVPEVEIEIAEVEEVEEELVEETELVPVEEDRIDGFDDVSDRGDSTIVVEEEMEVEEEWDWEEDDYGESDEEYAARTKAAVEQFTQGLFSIPTDSTILSNQKFVNHPREGNDMHLWMDYAWLGNMQGMESLLDPSTRGFLKAYQKMLTDASLWIDLNFNPGSIDFDYHVQLDEAWMRYVRSTHDSKLNRKFHKYIKGENLLGYLSINVNMENTLRGAKDLMLPLMEAAPEVGPMAGELIDIVDIVVDEQAIYEFFKGDMCMAVTGLREFERMVTTYDYDEEFNLIEKEELRKQTLPEFVMMMGYGREDDLKKFFRLGEKAGGLRRVDNYYQVTTDMMGMNLYLAYHKGILFFTNDDILIKNNLSSGWPAKERIAKKHRQLMEDNVQVVFWDIPKSLNSASALGMPFGDTGEEVVNVGKQSLESMLAITPKATGNSYFSKMSFRFANQQMNSLDQLFQFMEEIFKMESQGDRS